MLENLQIVICKLANDLIFLPNNWLGKINPLDVEALSALANIC